MRNNQEECREEINKKQWIKAHRDAWIRDLVRLVKIPSISQECNPESSQPFGPECARALDTALEIAKGMGLAARCHEYYCGTAVLPGTEPGCGDLGIFTHLDVVPPGPGWSYPPFEGIVKDGLVIARGSRDNKGAAIAALYAVRFLMEQNIRLRHGIRFFFGCNEELGMEDAVYYFKHHQAPVFSLVPDSPFPVCYGEKGVIDLVITGKAQDGNPVILSLDGGIAANQVPSSARAEIRLLKNQMLSGEKERQANLPEGIHIEKTDFGVLIQAEGRAAHSAYPEGSDNAVVKLAGYLIRTGLLTEEEQRWMEFTVHFFGEFYGEELGISCEDDITGKLTCVMSMMSVTEEGFKGTINIRYPVSADGKQICDKLKKRIEDAGFQIKGKMKDNPGYCMDRNHPAIDILNEIACRKLDLDKPPFTAKGGTYARKISAPVVSYGPNKPGPHPFGPGKGTGHLPDEAIPIEGVEDAMEIYIEALIALDKQLV